MSDQTDDDIDQDRVEHDGILVRIGSDPEHNVLNLSGVEGTVNVLRKPKHISWPSIRLGFFRFPVEILSIFVAPT